MAKTCAVAALIATIFCFSSFLNLAQATSETFFVEGKVYCDTCRVQFETKISQPLAGNLSQKNVFLLILLKLLGYYYVNHDFVTLSNCRNSTTCIHNYEFEWHNFVREFSQQCVIVSLKVY